MIARGKHQPTSKGCKKKTLTLYIKEDRLLPGTIVVLSTYDVLATVIQLCTVDDERVVFPRVPLHILD